MASCRVDRLRRLDVHRVGAADDLLGVVAGLTEPGAERRVLEARVEPDGDLDRALDARARGA